MFPYFDHLARVDFISVDQQLQLKMDLNIIIIPKTRNLTYINISLSYIYIYIFAELKFVSAAKYKEVLALLSIDRSAGSERLIKSSKQSEDLLLYSMHLEGF